MQDKTSAKIKKYSPSSLVGFYLSSYESTLNKYIVDHQKTNIALDAEDPFQKIISTKGDDHEKTILKKLKADGLEIFEVTAADRETMESETIQAMHDGVDIIYQGSISNNEFYGRTDFLIKNSRTSKLGDYSYEIWDAKLSKSIKPEHVIQLCCYADILNDLIGIYPDKGYIITGDQSKVEVALNDYYSFYQLIKNEFFFLQSQDIEKEPDPANYSNWGSYSEYAQKVLRDKDHLFQIANITRSNIQKLYDAGIHTTTDLINANKDHSAKLESRVFNRLQLQATLQKESRKKGKIQYKVLENNDQSIGLFRLPKKSSKDIYFDIESNPLNHGYVLHYLWGVAHEDFAGAFDSWWAHDYAQMKETFGLFIDWVYERWLSDSSMHVYHYGAFETSTIKSLMGEFGIKETKVDNLLRNGVFIDLYSIIKQSLCIGTEGYGLKKLEPLFRDSRINEVQSGQDSTVQYEAWTIQQDGHDHVTSKTLKEIWDYNKEDCESLIVLTDWLRNIQQENNIPPIAHKEEENTKEPEDIEKLLNELLSQLKDDSDKPHAQLLANLCLYHKRENKPVYWRLFERIDMTDEDLVMDLDSLGALSATGEVFDITSRSKGYEYAFDINQETKVKRGDQVILKQDTQISMTIHEIDYSNATCVLKTTAKELPDYISVINWKIISPRAIEDSIRNITTRYLQKGDIKSCLQNYLDKSRPKLKEEGDSNLAKWGDSSLSALKKIAFNLDGGYLCIQGPPGTGKTYVGAKLIAYLVGLGYKIGVASNSHKAIDNLLQAAVADLDEENIPGQICRINRGHDKLYDSTDRIELASSASKINFKKEYVIYGGTAWSFANPILEDQLDYLFVDESGQVSLANLVAMSASTKNLILMGDQMQLAQPTLGTHPLGCGVSSLDYILGNMPTIPSDIGILLPETYRLHPDICNFVSKKVYEGRIAAVKSNQKRTITPAKGSKYISSSGIKYIELDHYGNSQASIEEVEVIQKVTNELLKSTKNGYESSTITEDDILIISPFNHQTRMLQQHLGDKYQIGTVDKFQGRQAAVVIISMASSDVESSPRGIEFLFERNRLNVAITRAMSLAIIIGSKNLISTNTSNMNAMALTNFYLDLVQGT